MFSRLLLTPVLSLFIATGLLFAQDKELTLAPNHEIVIDGTSNARDWDAKVESVNAEFKLKGYNGNGLSLNDLEPAHFQTLTLQMPVESIDSGTRGLTRNIHKYLKGNDHPIITFELKNVKEIQTNGSTATITAEGVVTAAGKSLPVDMIVNAENDNNGSFTFSGRQDLKMTSFDIDPPTAMLGAVRARDEFSVIYKVTFQQ